MENWQETFDIVVVGSGIAGLSAAIEAATAGAKVLVIEKMKITGGNTRISDGGFGASNNYLQTKHQVEDSSQLFYDDMVRAGEYLNHPELVRIVVEQSSGAIDWLREELGVEFLDRLDRFGGHSAARCLTTQRHSGRDVTQAQTAKLESLNAEIRKRCCLLELIARDDGSVAGVEIGEDYQVSDPQACSIKHVGVKKAVILASGGFGNDIAFRSFLNPRLDDSISTTNHKGATAEALISALKLNAFPIHLSHIQLGPWGCPDEKGYGKAARFASYALYPSGILVDPTTGCRIVNEWGNRKQRADAIMATGHPCVGIVDSQGAQKDASSLEHCLKASKIKAFDTLDELEKAYAMPKGSLKQTLNAYHKGIDEQKEDGFGKALGQGALKVDTPPFYTMRLWPKVHHTPGGIGINSHAQVLDLDQNPISGLYAAGEVCGGIHGASRLGSCALTECLVFGRIAGRHAAALPNKG